MRQMSLEAFFVRASGVQFLILKLALSYQNITKIVLKIQLLSVIFYREFGHSMVLKKLPSKLIGEILIEEGYLEAPNLKKAL